MIDIVLNTRFVEKGNVSNSFKSLDELKAWYTANGKNGAFEFIKEDYYVITNFDGKTALEVGQSKVKG